MRPASLDAIPAPIREAMDRAFAAARAPRLDPNPNPRVGCVVLDEHGALVGEGAHLGIGTPHAEAAALRAAGDAARGGTAIVTLEPCNHIGLTGPCARALIDAGITEVYYAISDPHPHDAARGHEALAAASVAVHGDVDVDRGRELLGSWLFRVQHSRPFVTWKVAVSADGYIAPVDRSRVQLTGPAAQADVHRLRADVGAVVTGTGTVAADDPLMTVRGPADSATGYQPRRIAIGLREIAADAAIIGSDGLFTAARTHDVGQVLGALAAEGVHHVLLECGPGLADAFLAAGCVDEVVWYVSPVHLGSGIPASTVFGSVTQAAPEGWVIADTAELGADTRLRLLPDRRGQR